MALFRIIASIARSRATFPALAFFGGFAWDAGTLGRSIKSSDLFILLGYMVVASGILIWMGRRGSLLGVVPDSGLAATDVSEPGPAELGKVAKVKAWIRKNGHAFSLQFLFGSLFSALVILYFLSSSYWPGFLLVTALVALLILNEFVDSQYHRFTITWTLFGICAILFFNFAIPHMVHSIHPAWFFVSTAAGVGTVYGIKALSPKANGSTWPILVTAGVLILLFLANAIPPVPLVKKTMAICRNLVKADGNYTAEMEKPALLSFWRASESLVRQRPGEKIYCFTSVFLPSGIQTTLYHRWRLDNPRTGKWEEHSRIGFPIRGGRQEGFRGYSYKRNLTPGKWEVRVETESGRVLGTIHFRAETTLDSAMEMKKLHFD